MVTELFLQMSAPIRCNTFSSLDDNYDGMGEWGGIVVQGFAPQYGAGGTGACFAAGEAWCNVEGEGGTTIANYGGNLPADNSGVIRSRWFGCRTQQRS